jgi:hypothetical protein
MPLTTTKDSVSDIAPDQVEVLIKEARRRGRRQRLAIGVGVTAALTATAIAVAAIGIGGPALDKTRTRNPSNRPVSAAAWATARRTCRGRPMQAARRDDATAHMYGAYPTTVRLAINWPNRIYPLAGPPTPTTVINGRQPIHHFDPWQGYNSSRPALICIFTGDFRFRVPGMGGNSLIEHAKVEVMDQFSTWPDPNAISVWPMNSVPSRPVPVA